MFEILVEQSENLAKYFDISGWRLLLWLTVIEVKMIGKVFEQKEYLTWVREMEVKLWTIMIVISMMMIIVTVVGITRRAMFRLLIQRISWFRFQIGEGDFFNKAAYFKELTDHETFSPRSPAIPRLIVLYREKKVLHADG